MSNRLFLITGGSGFLGINLVRHLLAKGERVRSLDIAPFDYPEQNQVDCILGDVRNADTVAQAMRGVDIVVHCAAALPLYPADEIISTDVQGTHTVLEAARQANVDRFVHISSTAVYGIPDHHPLVEEDQLQGVGPYGEAKIQAEGLCVQYRADGMCVPILRPKSFIGPERLGVFAILYDWAKDGRGFPLIGSGRNRYQLLDVEDLCEAIYLCTVLPKEAVNDVFNIGAKEFATMREDYQAVLDEAGFGKKMRAFPAAPMIWALRFLEFLRISPLYKWVYETAWTDSFVSIEKAEKVLGFRPQYSNQQALVRNYHWYIQNMQNFTNTSGISHRAPWKQGALRFAKAFF